LFIAERIVTAHGGAIGVRSSLEEGTIFTVTMPAARALPAAAMESGASAAADAPQLAIG